MFSKSLCCRAGTAVCCSSSRRLTAAVPLTARFTSSAKKNSSRVALPVHKQVEKREVARKHKLKRREEESRTWGITVEQWDALGKPGRDEKRGKLRTQEQKEYKEAVKAAKELRATINAERKMKEPEVIRELPGDAKEDVLFDTLFGVRTMELNRPAKLNSLNGSMIRKLVPRLREWQKSDMANVVVMKGAGPKAFCAGGDVAALAEDNKHGAEGQLRSAEYFALEYKLNHLIATYPKPYIAYMDGITMGGGVGLSIHAPFRIATERTLFAMPETTIGFFPDVGASFFLPRMNGAVGTYLALTSQRLKGANAYYAGIATHYIHSTSLHAMQLRLGELRFKDFTPLEERLALINATMEEYVTGLPHDEPMFLVGELRKAIDRCFSHTNVPNILAALKAEIKAAESRGTEGQEIMDWAEKTLAILHQRSPTSVYVTLRQMQLGRQWSIAETFQREYQIASKFMAHSDFTEGVDALLIRKDGKPKWSPATLEEAGDHPNIADPFFMVDDTKQLRLLSTEQDYQEYPYQFGLPTEKEIRDVVKAGGKGRWDVVQHFAKIRHGKLGVKEVVQEVMERKTTRKENGEAIWVDEPQERSSFGEVKL